MLKGIAFHIPSSSRLSSAGGSAFLSEGSAPPSGSITPYSEGGPQQTVIFNIDERLSAVVTRLERMTAEVDIGKAKDKTVEEEPGTEVELPASELNNQELRHITAPEEAIFDQIFQVGGLSIKRFGMNPAAIQGAANYEIAADRLHAIEAHLLGKALEELQDKKSAQNAGKSEYANNVVLIDIFAREKTKTVIRADEMHPIYPETHTVALWKKTDDVAVLIDPNNRKFSDHFERDGVPKIMMTSGLPGNSLYNRGSISSAYSKYDVQQPAARDCIDLAVKIGLELNVQQLKETDVKVMEAKTYQMLTNQFRVNKKLGRRLNNTVMREPQSSTAEVREETANYVINNSAKIQAITAEKLREVTGHPEFSEKMMITLSYRTIKNAIEG